MQYQVIVPKKVQKEINRIDKKFHSKIITKNEWSLRVWPYRIIYQIKNKELVILIIKVGHRQGIYRYGHHI